MTRSLLLAAAFALAASGLPAQDPVPPGKTTPGQSKAIELYGMLDDATLMTAAPASRVITNEKDWVALTRAWKLKEPPKVDFTRDLIVVGTSRAGKMTLETKLDDKGDLQVNVLANMDTQAGFRYGIKSVARTGVRTVNGQPLPKDDEKRDR